MVAMTGLAGKASILAVGTELTSGQITNRNASWIAEKLVHQGVEVVLHETVADDRKAIREALDRCWSVSRIIFVCGGLGPTSDDFTREVVAEWLGKPLEFYEPTWTKILNRLGRLGIAVAPSNRQQAYYPAGASVLLNARGTADGFTCEIVRAGEKGRMWILPGPPPEIEAIWRDGAIENEVRRELPPETKPSRLFLWECLGKSEAELGELTEAALSGSGLSTGYRFHRPYVEVKVWIPEDRLTEAAPWLEKLEAAIHPWVVVKNGENLAAQFLECVRRADEIDVADACTGGLLAERLGAFLRKPAYRELSSRFTVACEWESPSSPEDWVRNALSQADEESLTLAIAGVAASSGEWSVGMREGTRAFQETLTSPLKNPEKDPELIQRSRMIAVEIALKKWRDWLRQSVS